MLKKIIITVVTLIIIGVIIVFKIYNKPHVNLAETSPDISIIAEELVHEFEVDENAANSKYLDQIIQVTGPISKIESENDKTIISIGKDELFGNVDCHMSTEEKNQFKKLEVGQNIAIKGVCTGYLMNVVLVRSVLTN